MTDKERSRQLCLLLECRSCGCSRLVAFGRKRRGFCPGCVARRMADTGFHILYLDGVYVLEDGARSHSPLVFHGLPTRPVRLKSPVASLTASRRS